MFFIPLHPIHMGAVYACFLRGRFYSALKRYNTSMMTDTEKEAADRKAREERERMAADANKA